MSLDNTSIGRNLGGILKVYIFKVQDIHQDDSGGLLTDNIQKMYFVAGTGRYRERQRKSKNGTIYEARLSLIIPKGRKEIITWLEENSEHYFNLICTDANQLTRRIGIKKRPLKLEVDYDTQRRVSGRNEYNFEFKGKLLRPAPVFDLESLKLKQN